MGKDSYNDIMFMDGPPKERPAMETGHRAKQFAPFAALRGFEGGLKKAEDRAEEDVREELCMREEEDLREEEA
jgi:hypothetical protein